MNSGLCATKRCDIGQQDPLAAINTAVNAFEREISTGVYTINDIPRLMELSSGSAVTRIETPIQRQIRLYGDTVFYTAVASLNAFFERPEINETIRDYPRVFERVQISPLTPIEIANFMDQYQYTPQNLTFQTGILNSKLLIELENFYTQNLSSNVIGSFCSLMPNIFGAIGSFFTALSNIQDFISQITNFAANLGSLLSNLRDQLMQVVDRIVENVRSIIENFSIDNIISEVRTFVEERIVSRFYEIREGILGFFNELNIENIRNRIRAMIDYAVKVFENPTLEEIQYLIYRFCNLASFIEETFNGLMNPLTIFRDNLQFSREAIMGRSMSNTARAVEAGATRLTPEEARGRSPQIIALSDPRPDRPSWGPYNLNIIPPTADELEAIDLWNDGNGNERIYFARNGSFFRTGACANFSPGRYGWENVSSTVRVMILRVQSKFGKRLRMQSGFRPEPYNACLRSQGNRGVALRSYHTDGIALDVSWDGFDDASMEEFVRLAREEGFTRVRRYRSSSFVHVDIAPRNAWGSQ
jgi:hypothetical protein